jgi:hypothetical protein
VARAAAVIGEHVIEAASLHRVIGRSGSASSAWISTRDPTWHPGSS